MKTRLNHLVFYAISILLYTVVLTHADYDQRLSEIIDSIISSRRQKHGFLSSNSGKSDQESMFAIEVNANDIKLVTEIARAAGFRIERKLHSFKNIYVARRNPRRRRDAAEIVEEFVVAKQVQWMEVLAPLFREKRQLYSVPTSLTSTRASMRIEEAWKAGFTGRGVSVSILDDGLDYHHNDLRDAFTAEISFDFTNNRPDPTPENGPQFSHGTHCAGIVSMTANNSRCGVGAAYGARLGGLKMLGESQIVNDAIEGDALAYALEHVDIYSVSWGPRDDGRSVERPQELAAKALERGAKMGRNGLGSLYVWASGNGGLQDDDCAMDGYASNKYTLTFGIASSEGISPWYAEGCPAIMASVNEGTRKISGMVTTDVGNRCTTFAGSSAAAPLAASILALTLEANPQLSQRDVQHLIVRTADPTSLMNSSARGWKTNGAGLHYSRFFGFGTMNALKMVQVAQKWTSVEGERTCSKDIVLQNGTFSSLSPLTTQISFEGCQGTYGEVNFVERVELAVSVTHGRRGAVHIYLTSPMGTEVQLLQPRRNDDSREGLDDWSLLSVGYWGERIKGVWKMETKEKSSAPIGGTLKSLRLIVHGTKKNPLEKNELFRL